MFEKFRRYWRPIVALTVLDGVGSLALYKFYIEYKREEALKANSEEIKQAVEWRPPRRAHLLEQLRGHGQLGRELDVLIIGGGATGTGCALDAAARGLRVACVEAEDWASGTSSKSTKLVHGGVRYLQKAITELDVEQYKLVDEALRERRTILKIAPHLTDQLPILLPIYK
jgi:glycerol-3-phosphate dehydrogenase